MANSPNIKEHIKNIKDAFEADGPLAENLSNYTPRESQIQLAEAIANTLANNEVLVAEAGTGTGKTFAYLVPALLSGKKIIVSTGTKNLQDQLFYKDLPVIRDSLKLSARVALLKGRANYLCLYRLESNMDSGLFGSRTQINEFNIVRDWATHTETGDTNELTDIQEDSQIWQHVTSTTDNCLGQECPVYSKCFLVKARRKAQEAEVVVVNHHLFFADLALKGEGFGELLPGADVVIFDEAHQLAEIASQFFGKALSSRQIIELARDTIAEYLVQAQDMVDLKTAAEKLEKYTLDMRLAFDSGSERSPWKNVSSNPDIEAAVSNLSEALLNIQKQLELAAVRSKGLENCWRRSQELSIGFKLLTGPTPEEQVHWFETYTRSFVLHITPMNVADEFSSHLEKTQQSWIFTSASLAVNQKFTHFTHSLGLDDKKCLYLESPFDYKQQAVFYVPKNLPEPQHRSYNDEIINAAIPVINAARGRTFFLFTSYRSLQYAAIQLAEMIEYPLLVQGSMPRHELLEKFRELGNAVLLGTSSFWGGVDVRGETLSCVIIDKLPFASPGDPILKARIDSIKEQGSNPFFEYQLPQAVIALKQGAGRLIRDINDTGVLMICDPRLFTKPYGKVFIKSLPDMAKTRDLDKVIKFLENKT